MSNHVNNLITEIDVSNPPKRKIFVGHIGETGFRKIVFLVDSWKEEFPTGTPTLVFKRADGKTYPVNLSQNDNGNPVFTPSSTETAFAGDCVIQLRWTQNEVLGKTCNLPASVESAIGSVGPLPDDDVRDYEEEISANTNARHIHSNKNVLDGITAQKVSKWDEGGTVDSELSSASTNPVQNKVVKAALDTKADVSALSAKQDALTAGQNITISGNTISADVDPTEIASNVTDWLDANVDPVGSAVVVDSSLSVSGAAADAKAVGDKVKNIDKITEWFLGTEETSSDVTDALTINADGRISPVDGSVVSSSLKNTSYMDLSGYEYVTYGRIGYASGTGEIDDYGMAFYNSSKSFISGQKAIRGVTKSGYQQTTLAIPTGAVYARFTLEVSASFPQSDFKVVLSNQQTPEGEIPSPPEGVSIPSLVDDVNGKITMPSGGQEGQVLVSDGEGGVLWGSASGEGLTEEAKLALLNCFRNVAWVNDQGSLFYQALHDALYPVSEDWDFSWNYTKGKLEDQDGWTTDINGGSSELVDGAERLTCGINNNYYQIYPAQGSSLRTMTNGYGILECTFVGQMNPSSNSSGGLRLTAAESASNRIGVNEAKGKFRIRDASTVDGGTAIADYTNGTEYTVRLVMKGTTVDIYINGTLVAENTTPISQSGGVNSVFVDNLGSGYYVDLKSLKLKIGSIS